MVTHESSPVGASGRSKATTYVHSLTRPATLVYSGGARANTQHASQGRDTAAAIYATTSAASPFSGSAPVPVLRRVKNADRMGVTDSDGVAAAAARRPVSTRGEIRDGNGHHYGDGKEEAERGNEAQCFESGHVSRPLSSPLHRRDAGLDWAAARDCGSFRSRDIHDRRPGSAVGGFKGNLMKGSMVRAHSSVRSPSAPTHPVVGGDMAEGGRYWAANRKSSACTHPRARRPTTAFAGQSRGGRPHATGVDRAGLGKGAQTSATADVASRSVDEEGGDPLLSALESSAAEGHNFESEASFANFASAEHSRDIVTPQPLDSGMTPSRPARPISARPPRSGRGSPSPTGGEPRDSGRLFCGDIDRASSSSLSVEGSLREGLDVVEEDVMEEGEDLAQPVGDGCAVGVLLGESSSGGGGKLHQSTSFERLDRDFGEGWIEGEEAAEAAHRARPSLSQPGRRRHIRSAVESSAQGSGSGSGLSGSCRAKSARPSSSRPLFSSTLFPDGKARRGGRNETGSHSSGSGLVRSVPSTLTSHGFVVPRKPARSEEFPGGACEALSTAAVPYSLCGARLIPYRAATILSDLPPELSEPQSAVFRDGCMVNAAYSREMPRPKSSKMVVSGTKMATLPWSVEEDIRGLSVLPKRRVGVRDNKQRRSTGAEAGQSIRVTSVVTRSAEESVLSGVSRNAGNVTRYGHHNNDNDGCGFR